MYINEWHWTGMFDMRKLPSYMQRWIGPWWDLLTIRFTILWNLSPCQNPRIRFWEFAWVFPLEKAAKNGERMVFYHTIHVLGVLEWFYMLTGKKNNFPKKQYVLFTTCSLKKYSSIKKAVWVFLLPSVTPPGMVKDHTFTIFLAPFL